jgi:hypothetical protein
MADREKIPYLYTRTAETGKCSKNAKKFFFTQKDPRLREDDENGREDDEKDRGDDENGRGDDDKRPGKTGAFMDWGVEFLTSR